MQAVTAEQVEAYAQMVAGECPIPAPMTFIWDLDRIRTAVIHQLLLPEIVYRAIRRYRVSEFTLYFLKDGDRGLQPGIKKKAQDQLAKAVKHYLLDELGVEAGVTHDQG